MNAWEMNESKAGAGRGENDVDATAAQWLAQREEGFSLSQAREFEVWCRRDSRHAAAVARLESACALLKKMPLVEDTLRPDNAVPFPSSAGCVQATHRQSHGDITSGHPLFKWIAIGLAASVAIGAGGWWKFGRNADSGHMRYATSAGGYERVTLNDGSILELNASSEARVQFSARERRVTLSAGEAHFSVAHDAARPFVVSAGDVSVAAVGTAFNVRMATAGIEVLVTEGTIRLDTTGATTRGQLPSLSPPDAPESAGQTFLKANERALISAARPTSAAPTLNTPRIERVELPAIRQALAWQERKLLFVETPLRDVVAQFNRRNSTQLILADAALGDRPVGGTFAADNVEAFVWLLENAGYVTVERRGTREIILREAP